MKLQGHSWVITGQDSKKESPRKDLYHNSSLFKIRYRNIVNTGMSCFILNFEFTES